MTRPDGLKVIFEWLYVAPDGVRHGDQTYSVDEVGKVLVVGPQKRFVITGSVRASARDTLKLLGILNVPP